MANLANQPIFCQKGWDGSTYPVNSGLKRTPMQDFNSFFIMFYCNISPVYQKIGDLFCPVHISGLSHSVNLKEFFKTLTIVKYIAGPEENVRIK